LLETSEGRVQLQSMHTETVFLLTVYALWYIDSGQLITSVSCHGNSRRVTH